MEDIRKGICPLCQHTKIVEAWPVELGHGNTMHPVAAATTTSSWGSPHFPGALATFICQQCGFTQWFTASPQEIPIGEKFRTRLIDGRPDSTNGPFR